MTTVTPAAGGPSLVGSAISGFNKVAADLQTATKDHKLPSFETLSAIEKTATDAMTATRTIADTSTDQWDRRNAGIALESARKGAGSLGSVTNYLDPAAVVKPAWVLSDAQMLGMLDDAKTHFTGAANAYMLESMPGS